MIRVYKLRLVFCSTIIVVCLLEANVFHQFYESSSSILEPCLSSSSESFMEQFSVDTDIFLKIRFDLQLYRETDQWYEIYPTKLPTDYRFYTAYTSYRLRLKQLEDIPVLRPDWGPVINDVINTTYHINEYHLCHSFRPDKTNVLVAINSAANHFKARRLLRETWLSSLKNGTFVGDISFHYIFFLGISNDSRIQHDIENEHSEFSDIVQADIVDRYQHLSQKSISLLNWVREFCPTLDFLIKCDDDVYVNVNNLFLVMKKVKTRNGIYGRGVVEDKPKRHEGSKYYVSSKIWPWTNYPLYLLGGMYILGNESIIPLLAAAQTTPLFPLEDVYLTGICAEAANITRHSSKRLYEHIYPQRLSSCFVHNTVSWQTKSMAQLVESHRKASQYHQWNLCGLSALL